jgi:hypothetical protein
MTMRSTTIRSADITYILQDLKSWFVQLEMLEEVVVRYDTLTIIPAGPGELTAIVEVEPDDV